MKKLPQAVDFGFLKNCCRLRAMAAFALPHLPHHASTSKLEALFGGECNKNSYLPKHYWLHEIMMKRPSMAKI